MSVLPKKLESHLAQDATQKRNETKRNETLSASGVMIIYDPRSYGSTIFRLHGSVLPTIAPQLIIVEIISLFACIINEATKENEQKYPLPDDGHKIFGFLVGFLLVFRSTIAHKRYVDGVAKLTALRSNCMELTRKICVS